MARLALLGAMESEVKALVSAMDVVERHQAAGFDVWTGRLFGRDCIVARCGMGKVAAAATAQYLIDRSDAAPLIFCGLAGSLQPNLGVGDVVVGARFVQHDMDASPIFPRWELPGLGVTFIEPAPELIEAALAAAKAYLAGGPDDLTPEQVRRFGIEKPAAEAGLIVTGDQFVTESERPALLSGLPDAACVDMEGGAIAQVCLMNSRPFLVIRVMSDNADASAYASFAAFVEEVAPHYCLGIVRELLARLP